jgi:hypothetical protein
MGEGFEVPEDFVPAFAQAHSQGLLMINEAAKLLDMQIPDLALEAHDGHIEITARCNNLPCFSLQAIDAYKRSRHAEAS